MKSNNNNKSRKRSSQSNQQAAIPASPKRTISTTPKLEMKRPLCIINGKTYAVTWCWIDTEISEELDNTGNIVKLTPPRIEKEMGMVVIREDGKVYGLGTPLSNVGFEIKLGERLSTVTRWSEEGVSRFLNGNNPDPLDIFNRLCETIDHFIDFSKSLSDPKIMCEFVACFIFTTWFLEAFNVTGYLWITGDKGCGKTNLLLLITELSYLGFFTSISGTFASLRDLADYGATLGFDDAELLSDPKKTDPDKRAILLSGNHRGIQIPLKEYGPNKKWETRYVNAFCSKAISAIELPDSVMASRSIILPLIRTANISKGNLDPKDYEVWPHDRKVLIDDLWALTTRHLSILPKYDRWVGRNSKLVGRNLQPWRSVLAVSKWLDDQGLYGLFQRMEQLSLNYQDERLDLETSDLARVILQALCELAVRAVSASSANTNNKIMTCKLTAREVHAEVININSQQDIGVDPADITLNRIGRYLSRFRFKDIPRPGGIGSRIREVPFQDLVTLCQSYQVKIPSVLINHINSIVLL